MWFVCDRVNDRAGNALPITNLDIDALANARVKTKTMRSLPD